MKTETKTESRLFFCPECSKGFGRKGDLKRHQDLHDGRKPYICKHPGCGKSFSQASGLKTHNNVHTRAKPYVCSFDGCEAAFGDPSSCARHRKETHRRVGGYRCPHPRCNSKIKRRSAFTAHLKRHRIDPVAIDIDSLAPPLLPAAIPIPCRKPNGRLSDLPLKLEDCYPAGIPDVQKLHYRYVEHLRPAPFLPGDLPSVLGTEPFSVPSSTYSDSYPNSVPSSVLSASPLHATLSCEFESNVMDNLGWEDSARTLYRMEPSSDPSDVNMFGSPSPSPPPSLPPSAEGGPSSNAPCLVEDLDLFAAFNSYGFSSYLLPQQCYYMGSDHFPSRRVVEISPFVCEPAPEASWVFA